MAGRKLIVEIVGDASSLHKSFLQAEKATTGFDRSMRNAGRGALSASISFAGLRRSVLSTSAAFIGGVGIVAGIKSTISAAEESQRVLGQTRIAVDNSGQSWDTYGKRIQAAATATANLSGFDDERLLGTFSSLVRRTHDVNEALRLNALAADVARGRNIELEQAAQLVLKASLGQAGALRRVGIAADKNATSVELLDLLQRSFAGSAEAYGKTATGAQERFQVALENTQEIIGNALLPSLTTLLNKTTEWLNQPKNQAKIETTVAQTATEVGKLAHTFNTLVQAGKKVTDGLKGLNDAVGGNTDEYRKNEKALQKELDALGNLADAQKRVADGYAAIEAARSSAAKSQPLPLNKGTVNIGGPPPTAAQQRAIALAQFGGTGSPEEIAAINAQIAAIQRAIDFAKSRIKSGKGNVRKFADALASLFTELASQRARLAAIAQDQANKAEAAAAKTKAAAAKAKAAREKMRQAITDMANEALSGADLGITGESLTVGQINRAVAANERAARQRAQFVALGLTAGGDELAPTRKALQAGLAGIQKSIKGTILDTDKNRNLIGRIRKVLSGQFGALSREVRLKINDLEDALKGDKKGGPLTAQSALNIAKITRGLGLDDATLRALNFRLAGAHLTTGVGATRSRQATVVVQHTTSLDGREIERSVSKHQIRQSARTAKQTRGRVLP